MEKDSCLTCAKLFECSATSETCEKYEYCVLDKSAITTRYLKAVKKLNEAISELKQAEVGLGSLKRWTRLNLRRLLNKKFLFLNVAVVKFLRCKTEV